VSESAVSAKRGWGWFGAKPAQSETPVGAAAERRPPGRGEEERRCAASVHSYCWSRNSTRTMLPTKISCHPSKVGSDTPIGTWAGSGVWEIISIVPIMLAFNP
jgi:hypothetical protein